MLKRANIQWSAKQLAKMATSGSIKFDNACQRGHVWDVDRKSLLIHSMIEGYPIPAFYAVKGDNGLFDCLDGKQRTEAIRGFINNEYELTENTPTITLESGYEDDISGMTFERLDEEIQDRIKDYSLTVYYYESLTEEEINTMFFRLNNGKPFTAIELTRVKAKSIDTIRELAKHPIFTEALNEKAINKYTNEDIIIKSWIVLYNDNKSLETKLIRPLMETADITEEQKEQIDNVLTRINDSHTYINLLYEAETNADKKKTLGKILKRIYTRTHLISIVPITLQSINENVLIDAYANWLTRFYSGKKKATANAEYNEAAEHGANDESAVKTRLQAIQDDYKAYFKTNTEEESKSA